MNAEFCQNFEEETGRIEPGLDPINSPVKDETAMNLLRLESRIDGAVDYLAVTDRPGTLARGYAPNRS